MPTVKRRLQPDLHYEIDDYTDPWRNAPCILLQHGFARSSKFWYRWVPYLSRFYKVIRPDLRGFGQSSKAFDLKSGIGVDIYLDDLEAIIDDAGAGSVHYAGESMGGVLGILLAAQRPSRVRTLSVVSTPMYFDKGTRTRSALGHDTQEEALRKLGARGYALAKNTADRFPPATDPELMAWFADQQGASDVEVMIATQRLLYTLDATDYLPRIQAPVLGMFPSHDTHASPEQVELFRTSIPNNRVVQLPSRHHNLHCVYAAACAREVLYFAAQHDGIACHE